MQGRRSCNACITGVNYLCEICKKPIKAGRLKEKAEKGGGGREEVGNKKGKKQRIQNKSKRKQEREMRKTARKHLSSEAK